MKYNILPEFRKYSLIRIPFHKAGLKLFNFMMPLIQKSSSPYEDQLETEEVDFNKFKALLIKPKGYHGNRCLVYCHGGGFVLKAAGYHQNLVREYAYRADTAVLFVDYRLAVEHPFPIPLVDCLKAYYWAFHHYEHVFVGGDSAGGSLACGVILKAREIGYRMPEKLMLIYPVTDSRMQSESMRKYTDTPIWNAKYNRLMWQWYTKEADRHHPCASIMEADSFRQFPETYIETAEYDCLHDEGIALAHRLQDEGIHVILNETKGTIHGFDLAQDSAYVKACIQKRIDFLVTDHKVIL